MSNLHSDTLSWSIMHFVSKVTPNDRIALLCFITHKTYSTDYHITVNWREEKHSWISRFTGHSRTYYCETFHYVFLCFKLPVSDGFQVSPMNVFSLMAYLWPIRECFLSCQFPEKLMPHKPWGQTNTYIHG